MKNRFLKYAAVFLAVLMCGNAFAETETWVKEISKYGNLVLEVTGAELFEQGYEYGDLLNVTIAGQTWQMPLGSNYSDVDSGLPVVRAAAADEEAVAALNMGDLATAAGIAVKVQTDDEPGYRWEYLLEQPVQVSFSMGQEDGYREQWLIHQLVRTNERSDYAHLSDEAFANFRMVDTGGIGTGKLYRSSSPINPEIGRSIYADQAARKAGIATIVNLADASNLYESSADAYYPTCNTVYLNLGVDFASADFREGLAKGLRFMIEQEPPYLVHCTEGKDRAGFVSAVLECLMGASAEEVVADYMETYFNYYGVEPGTEKYHAVVNSNIVKILTSAFRIEDFDTADLAQACERFLLEETGLSQEEIDLLKAKLSE